MHPITDDRFNGPYIFISYAHLDSNTVLPHVFDLINRGYRVWYDAGIEAGTEWPEYIAEHLYESSVILTFISKYYLNSQNCLREIQFAAQLKKKIIFVYLESLVLPGNVERILKNASILYCKDNHSRARFMDNLCSLAEVSGCKDESAAMSEEDNSMEDDLFYGKELLESGNAAEGVRRLKRAAEKGSAEAQYIVSTCYSYGNGVAKDEYESAKRCRLAAEAGYLAAQKELGCCYLNGHGVEKNPYEAVRWFKKCAEAGYAECQF